MITCITGSDDILASGNLSGEIKIRYYSDEEIISLKGHNDSIIDINLINPSTLVSAGFDSRILIWDLVDKQPVREIFQLKESIQGGFIQEKNRVSRTWKVLNYGQNIIVFCGENNMIQFYNILKGEIVKQLKGHRAPIYAMDILSDKRIVSGGKDQAIFVWN